MHMEPVSAPRMTEIGLALRYLVRMMRELVIYYAAVYIEIYAEML